MAQNHTKTGGEHIEFKNKVDNTNEASEECSQVTLNTERTWQPLLVFYILLLTPCFYLYPYFIFVVQMFEALKLKRKHRYIIFKIGENQIEVESAGERSATLEEFSKALPFTDCRYGMCIM